jgi:ferredoxin
LTQVSIDPELCIGSGDCGRIVPAAFVLDERAGVSVPLPGAAAAPIDALVQAALNCPTNAIRVADDHGNVLVESNG